MPTDASLFDRMSALTDTTRSRLLSALELRELTVSELCSVTQLPQSTVSRHLKLLSDEGWVGARREGTSRLYRSTIGDLDETARRLWELVRTEVAALPATRQDRQRLEAVLAERRTRSQAFFSSAAGNWDAVRRGLFGARADLSPLLALLDDGWTVGDLGCGTGATSRALSPFVRRVVAVDDSPAMLAAARERLAGCANVELRRGTLEELPVADGELDAACLFLVLHHLPDPGRALVEAARALAPGGRLVISDMAPHDREQFRQEMGHQWLGFAAEQIAGWLEAAGFTGVVHRELPADLDAQGPTLFAASARRPPIPAGRAAVPRAASGAGDDRHEPTRKSLSRSLT